MELAVLARRLNNVEYLAAVDEPAHNELMQSVTSMGGKPVPSNFPYAWRRNYEELERLIRENGDGVSRQTFKPYVDPIAKYVTDWKAYHTERSLLLNMALR
jgi:hypothetical protein